METNVYLETLAKGYTCPRCKAGADEPCTTVSGRCHSARVDRAVRLYQKAN